MKVWTENRLHYIQQRLLDNTAADRWDAELSGRAVRLGDFNVPNWLGQVALLPQFAHRPDVLFRRIFGEAHYALNVNAGCGLIEIDLCKAL